MPLGQVCAAGVVALDVACYQCPRKGRYRITRLVDRLGAGKDLPALCDMPGHGDAGRCLEGGAISQSRLITAVINLLGYVNRVCVRQSR